MTASNPWRLSNTDYVMTDRLLYKDTGTES
jgi:hypothetical protein